METNHIKGHWAIYGDVDGQTAICDEDSTIIAYLDNWTGSSEGKKASNAHLIAAAPDLLATLRELVRCVRDEFSCSHPLCEAADRAHAAIAKATGEQLSNL